MLRRRLIPIEVTCDNWQRVHQGSNWPVPVNDQSSRIVFSCHTFSCIVRGRLRLLLKLWIELWCFRFWNTYLKTCQHVVSGLVSRQPRRSSGTSFSEIKVLVWLRSTVPGQLEDGRAARFGPPWILTPLFLLLFKRFSAQLWSCSSTWTKTKPYQVIQNTNETRKKSQRKINCHCQFCDFWSYVEAISKMKFQDCLATSPSSTIIPLGRCWGSELSHPG